MTIYIAALLIMDCLVLGFTKMFVLMEVFVMWLAIWNKKMDVVGFLMLAGLFLLINYVVVYGEEANLLESPKITAAGILIPMILFAFITRALINEQLVF